MVDGREKSDLYHAYDQTIEELGLQVMETVLPDSKRFRREMTDWRAQTRVPFHPVSREQKPVTWQQYRRISRRIMSNT
jgi:hypothetical protein